MIIIKILKKLRNTIAYIILKIFGWKYIQTVKIPNKAILINGPHTSYWDSFWSILGRYAFLSNVHLYAFFKSEANKSFWGKIYRSMGGIPIDRRKIFNKSKDKSMVDVATDIVKNMKSGLLAISPEGSRKLRKKWKSGFYYIAYNAKVPIIIGIIDYVRKEIGIVGVVHPTGNFEEDMKKINKFYEDLNAKYPEKFSIHKIDR